MIQVNVINGHMEQKEIDDLIDYAVKSNPEKVIDSLDVKIDGEYVDVTYHFNTVPFERIRRITGYLVGTLDRFNDAKKAEVQDRVTHSLTDDEDIYIS